MVPTQLTLAPLALDVFPFCIFCIWYLRADSFLVSQGSKQNKAIAKGDTLIGQIVITAFSYSLCQTPKETAIAEDVTNALIKIHTTQIKYLRAWLNLIE